MSETALPAVPAGAGAAEPISRALFRLALPILASQALRIAYQWVDALWVRGLGVHATAAVTTSVFVIWWIFALNDVIAIGAVAYVSQLLGAGDRQRAGWAAYKAVRASGAFGLAVAVAGVFFSRPVYGWMSATPEVVEQGTRYLTVVLAGAPFFMVSLTSEGILRAAGDSRTPLFVDLGAVTLNALLSPLLIYGPGPFPRLGVAGAAWATVIVQVAMSAAYVTFALRGHRAFPFARRAPGPPIRIAGMARVGVPAALIGVLFSVVYICFASSASRFGAASMAVVGIVNRVESISYLIAVAIGIAGATLVGQNLGAGRPERAEQAIRTGIRWNLGVSVALSVVMLAIPDVFLTLFTADPAVHRLGVPYLRIMAACFLFNGIEIVIAEAVMGSGHTTAISTIFCTVSLLRLPLAYLVPDWTGLGVLGIALVISGSCIARSLLIMAWAARGTWKKGLRAELTEGARS